MKKISEAVICVAMVFSVLGAANAQFAKPEDAIKYRKAVMFLIAQHFKRMGAVVQGKAEYEKGRFSKDAEAVKVLATLPWEAMLEPGTDKGDTTLSEAVFKVPEKFKEAAKTFEEANVKLADLASEGDFEGIKGQFGAVAGSCKSCHSQFRSK